MKEICLKTKHFKTTSCFFPDCNNLLCTFSHSSIECPHCKGKCSHNQRICKNCNKHNGYQSCKNFLNGMCKHRHGIETNRPYSCDKLHGWKCYKCKVNISNVFSICKICKGPRMEINGF